MDSAAEAIVAPLRAFIVEAALHDGDDKSIVEEIARRLHEGPMQLVRMSVAHTTLHPLVRAQDVVWTATGGLASTRYFHADLESETFRVSPLRYILDNDLASYRHRLDGDDLPFPAFRDFAAAGGTEYASMLVAFSRQADQAMGRGIFISFVAGRPGGFGDDLMAVLELLRNPLALAFRILIERSIAEAIATTYLGRVAARRVLDGAIRRGDAETVPAAIWYSDLRAFTPLSEALTADETITFLNEVFEATAGAISDAGGEVLDFIGDAVLAIFPLENDGIARALTALDDALERLALLRLRHSGPETPEVILRSVSQGLVGIAIAAGNVRFGNIGTVERLSFSVIGPTVNMVARIEALTKVLGEAALVTAAIAEAAPERFRARGKYALDGVLGYHTLYSLAKLESAKVETTMQRTAG